LPEFSQISVTMGRNGANAIMAGYRKPVHKRPVVDSPDS
jgi:hypothetical protein